MTDANVLALNCRNFRSYRTLFLSFDSRFVVFFGENGAGKTNILEAISLFSQDRGLRKATISDLNSIAAKPFSWNIEMVLQNKNCKEFMGTSTESSRRIAKINNAPAKSLSSFEELCWLLWITPSMDSVFIGPMVDRRSFFEHLVGGFDKTHKDRLKKLANLQRERLHILLHRKDEAWLQLLEIKIAEENIKITKSRYEFLQILAGVFSQYASEFLRPIVDISGEIENVYTTNSEENAILEIAEILKRNRFEDCEKQSTSVSINRTIWNVKHVNTNMSAENCSTGEQKAFLISLMLATLRIYQRCRNGIPILLLDDLMTNLDRSRRKHLVDELLSINVQTFFTGTDRYLFDDLNGLAQMYHVQKSMCTISDDSKHIHTQH